MLGCLLFPDVRPRSASGRNASHEARERPRGSPRVDLMCHFIMRQREARGGLSPRDSKRLATSDRISKTGSTAETISRAERRCRSPRPGPCPVARDAR